MWPYFLEGSVVKGRCSTKPAPGQRYHCLKTPEIHRVCKKCYAPCCRYPAIQVPLTAPEWWAVQHGKLNWKVRFEHHKKGQRFWRLNSDMRSLRSLMDEEEEAKEVIVRVREEEEVLPYLPSFLIPHSRSPAATRLRRMWWCAFARQDGLYRVYLAKKPDGSCLYLRNDGVCAIYKNRPHGCKGWFCGRGTEDDHMWYKFEEYFNGKPERHL